MSADGLGRGLVVARDHDDADAGHAAGLHGGRHLRPGRVMHPHNPQQRQVLLVLRLHLHSSHARLIWLPISSAAVVIFSPVPAQSPIKATQHASWTKAWCHCTVHSSPDAVDVVILPDAFCGMLSALLLQCPLQKPVSGTALLQGEACQ